MFYFDKIDGKKILKSDFIDNAFFTTREIYICDKGENDNSEVKNNIKIIENYLGKNLVSPTQTHSANIDTAIENKFDYPDTDGLILTNKSQSIFLNFADCTPIILYDKKQNIGAISHAGWRGTAQKIAPKTVKKMVKEFNSNTKDIVAIIGPAICGKCYEVGEDVYKQLSATIATPITHTSPQEERNFYVDLKEINKIQLAEIGVEKVEVCPYCTCCDNDLFFSYRKENGTTLRHSAILKLL